MNFFAAAYVVNQIDQAEVFRAERKHLREFAVGDPDLIMKRFFVDRRIIPHQVGDPLLLRNLRHADQRHDDPAGGIEIGQSAGGDENRVALFEGAAEEFPDTFLHVFPAVHLRDFLRDAQISHGQKRIYGIKAPARQPENQRGIGLKEFHRLVFVIAEFPCVFLCKCMRKYSQITFMGDERHERRPPIHLVGKNQQKMPFQQEKRGKYRLFGLPEI